MAEKKKKICRFIFKKEKINESINEIIQGYRN